MASRLVLDFFFCLYLFITIFIIVFYINKVWQWFMEDAEARGGKE